MLISDLKYLEDLTNEEEMVAGGCYDYCYEEKDKKDYCKDKKKPEKKDKPYDCKKDYKEYGKYCGYIPKISWSWGSYCDYSC